MVEARLPGERPNRRVTLIPGDGIGPEVVAAARAVIDASGADIEWEIRPAGAAASSAAGDSLPDAVVESIRTTGVALKGPTATSINGERPVSVRLRAALDLEVGVRPVRTWPGVSFVGAANGNGLDVLLLRMLSEDLYAGHELDADDPATARLRDTLAARGRAVPPDTAFSLKPMSAGAIERFARAALSHARDRGRGHVTIVHKATVMRATDRRFLAIVRGVANELGGFEVDDRLVDTACLELIRHPDRFDVLLAPVMYGDILSDVIAGLAGGLGLAPGANLGPGAAVFEPVHGTAPKLAGMDRADPIAAILTGAMLLRHVGAGAAADRIETAVGAALEEGRVRTYDLAGRSRDDPAAAGTTAMTEAVIAALPGR
jgi:isocitrate dehydrogenase (NAD+)